MPRPAKLVYSRQAATDLQSIFDFIASDSPRAAAHFVEEMDHAIARLASFPKLGVIPRDARLRAKGYRVLVVGEYLVFYVIRENTLRIRRVIHGARRYAFLL